MEITEEGIIFVFDDEFWEDVRDFDKTNPDYRKIEKLNGTKAIDIIGYHKRKGLYLIEIKDFRQYRIEKKDRIAKLELFEEVGQKVKDTLACMLAAAHNSTHSREYWCRQVNRILMSKSERVTVALWLEEDRDIAYGTEVSQKRKKVSESTYRNKLKTKVSWFTSRVKIISSQGTQDLEDLNLTARLL
jgi:hypothetical protein